MEKLGFNYNDGGRAKYFSAERVGDCVCRAIAIGNDMDYKEVYDLINKYAKKEHVGKRKKGISNARNGVYKDTIKRVLEDLGWTWVATMEIGKGCQVHLRANEIPMNETIIVNVSKHTTCVKNGVINDTYDCSREGTRCVYGYYIKRNKNKLLNEDTKNVIKTQTTRDITINDIKDYIKELKIMKETIEGQIIKNQEMVNWCIKQINYFEKKIKEIIGGAE
ncbi:MAG: hypothetical protein IJH20_06630 [Bacilli bacterium]|nr:hypothetical protein [Bacilli bacterium]